MDLTKGGNRSSTSGPGRTSIVFAPLNGVDATNQNLARRKSSMVTFSPASTHKAVRFLRH